MGNFRISTAFTPGDQPRAIKKRTYRWHRKKAETSDASWRVTGSGKRFTIANVIANVGKPALVTAHNKTLASQLYGEFKGVISRKMQ